MPGNDTLRREVVVPWKKRAAIAVICLLACGAACAAAFWELSCTARQALLPEIAASGAELAREAERQRAAAKERDEYRHSRYWFAPSLQPLPRVDGSPLGRTLVIRSRTRVRGGLDKYEVLTVVFESLGELQGCYERALSRDPSLSGMLVIEWRIRADGRVEQLYVVLDTLDDEALRTCIHAVLARLEFPGRKDRPTDVACTIAFQRVPGRSGAYFIPSP